MASVQILKSFKDWIVSKFYPAMETESKQKEDSPKVLVSPLILEASTGMLEAYEILKTLGQSEEQILLNANILHSNRTAQFINGFQVFGSNVRINLGDELRMVLQKRESLIVNQVIRNIQGLSKDPLDRYITQLTSSYSGDPREMRRALKRELKKLIIIALNENPDSSVDAISDAFGQFLSGEITSRLNSENTAFNLNDYGATAEELILGLCGDLRYNRSGKVKVYDRSKQMSAISNLIQSKEVSRATKVITPDFTSHRDTVISIAAD